jgi:DNA-binding NtrC family response regulator
MDALRRYPWPGNVRQLQNVIEASMAVETEEYITLGALRQFLLADEVSPDLVASDEDYSTSLTRFETAYFGQLLRECGGNVEQAAARAGVNLATFYRKIKKYGLK